MTREGCEDDNGKGKWILAFARMTREGCGDDKEGCGDDKFV